MANSVEEWRKTSRVYQQNMYNRLGDRYWDLVEDEHLPKKIGYALYSAPSVLKDGNLHYTEGETKHINEIVSHIKTLKPKHSTMTYIAYVFVVVRMKTDRREGVVVIFKTPRYSSDERVNLAETFIIDPTCRTYKDWNDYLDNNNLPKCYMCYPVDGIYRAIDGIVDIRFCESPECRKDVLKVLDISSSVVTVSAAAVNIAALAFPISLPVVWGATAALVASGSYDITRGVCKLVDNNKHQQSIGFGNSDARRAWINIIASGVGIAAVGGTAVARSFRAISGTALSSAEVLALRVINVSSLAFGSVSIGSELWNVVSKFLDGTLNIQDILQFAAACLFFVNLYLSYRTAEKLIQEVASNSVEMINLFSTRSSDFNVIKSINTFTESSLYSFVRTVFYGVQPLFFPNIDLNDVESTAFNIRRLIGKLQSGEISWNKFVLQGTEQVMSIWKRYEKFFYDAWNEMCEAFNVKDLRYYYFKEVGYKPFSSVNPDVPHFFNMTTNSTVSHIFNDNRVDNIKEEKKLIIHIGQEFIEKFPESNCFDYINKFKFFCDYFVGEFNNFRMAYESSLDEATSRLASNFNRQEFDQAYGIVGERVCHFLFNQTMTLFETDTKIFNKMNTEYNKVKHSLPGMPTGFLQSDSSVYYTFCGPKGQKVLTEQQYWSKAKELTGVGFNNETSTILRQKNFVLITPTDVDTGITALLFYGTFEKSKDCVMGVLTVLKTN